MWVMSRFQFIVVGVICFTDVQLQLRYSELSKATPQGLQVVPLLLLLPYNVFVHLWVDETWAILGEPFRGTTLRVRHSGYNPAIP